jgi:hypothetical protein
VDEAAREVYVSLNRLCLCKEIGIDVGASKVGNFVDVSAYSASDPVVACLDGFGASHFACIVCYLNSCRVVAIDWSWGLRIPDCSEALSLKDSLLAVDVEGCVF